MEEFQGFQERLNLLIEQNFASKSDFARAMGISRGTFSSQITRGNECKISFIYSLLKVFPNLNLYWLLYGSNPMLWPSIPKYDMNISDRERGYLSIIDACRQGIKMAEAKIAEQEVIIENLRRQLINRI